MSNLKINQEYISEQVSRTYSAEYDSPFKGTALTPMEAASKIWSQWMHCRFLAKQIASSEMRVKEFRETSSESGGMSR